MGRPKKIKDETAKPKTKRGRPKKIKVPVIANTGDFVRSLYDTENKPCAVLFLPKSIICATMYCECGFSFVKRIEVQGDEFVKCKCGKVYSLDMAPKLIPLKQEHLNFLNLKMNIDLS